MSPWTESQATRLAFEYSLLLEKLPGFEVYEINSPGKANVSGNYLSSANNEYTLCAVIKKNFPFEMPSLYVTRPLILIGYGGVTIQSYGTSHTMHVWSSDWNNYVKICHWRDEFWSAEYTILSVLMKGILWVEAFEAHRKTGKSIDEFSRSF